MRILFTLGAVLSAVSIIAYAQPELTQAFTSGDWSKIAGGLAVLLFAGGAWLAKTQRADIQRLREKIDAHIERSYEREGRTIETIHKFSTALSTVNKSNDRLSAAIADIERKLAEQKNGS